MTEAERRKATHVVRDLLDRATKPRPNGDTLLFEAARLITQQSELLEHCKQTLSESVEMEKQISLLLFAVASMRAKQRTYFKSRSADDLVAAKTAENDVDRIVDEMRTSGDRQRRLPF
jgi:hypothetical protein